MSKNPTKQKSKLRKIHNIFIIVIGKQKKKFNHLNKNLIALIL